VIGKRFHKVFVSLRGNKKNIKKVIKKRVIYHNIDVKMTS